MIYNRCMYAKTKAKKLCMLFMHGMWRPDLKPFLIFVFARSDMNNRYGTPSINIARFDGQDVACTTQRHTAKQVQFSTFWIKWIRCKTWPWRDTGGRKDDDKRRQTCNVLFFLFRFLLDWIFDDIFFFYLYQRNLPLPFPFFDLANLSITYTHTRERERQRRARYGTVRMWSPQKNFLPTDLEIFGSREIVGRLILYMICCVAMKHFFCSF